jgi:hypothetical protein
MNYEQMAKALEVTSRGGVYIENFYNCCKSSVNSSSGTPTIKDYSIGHGKIGLHYEIRGGQEVVIDYCAYDDYPDISDMSEEEKWLFDGDYDRWVAGKPNPKKIAYLKEQAMLQQQAIEEVKAIKEQEKIIYDSNRNLAEYEKELRRQEKLKRDIELANQALTYREKALLLAKQNEVEKVKLAKRIVESNYPHDNYNQAQSPALLEFPQQANNAISWEERAKCLLG